MDTTAWLLSGLLPASIAAVACWLASRLAGERPVAGSPAVDGAIIGRAEKAKARSAAVLSLGWTAAVSAGLLAQRWAAGGDSSFWWPDEFWQRGYWWLWAAALLLGATAWSSLERSSGRWVAAGLLAIGTAVASLPEGEGWEDTLPLNRNWMLLLATSCLLGFWSLDRLARRESDRWLLLVVLATLAGPMMVGVTTYGALTQWTIAAISATVVCVAFALAGRLVGAISIVYPSTVFVTVVIAAGRFYSYEDPPWWSYAGVLYMAPAVSAVDRMITARSTWIRVCAAASVAALMFAASALWHFADLQ